MKIPGANSSLFERIDYGAKKAIEDAILEHKKQGRSILRDPLKILLAQ
jgi:hypothetical protein